MSLCVIQIFPYKSMINHDQPKQMFEICATKTSTNFALICVIKTNKIFALI